MQITLELFKNAVASIADDMALTIFRAVSSTPVRAWLNASEAAVP
jgi:N-methylhydantoinase B/oxoprolinase/acetone carboxylase alpha subunit